MEKGCGGAIGLTGTSGALSHWVVEGPAIARITAEFKNHVTREHGDAHNIEHLHHETPETQSACDLHEGCQNTYNCVSRDREFFPEGDLYSMSARP